MIIIIFTSNFILVYITKAIKHSIDILAIKIVNLIGLQILYITGVFVNNKYCVGNQDSN